MKQIINNIRAWWNAKREQMRKNNALRKYNRLVEEAERMIQVQEFDGKVYFSVSGQPLLEAEDLTGDWAFTVANARDVWVRYQMNDRTPDFIIPTYHGDR